MSILDYVNNELKEKYEKQSKSRTSMESYCEKNERT